MLILLSLAALGCQTLEDFITLEGPEDLATDAPLGVASPTAPISTPESGEPTLLPPATPEAALDLTLDQADDAEAALRPEFAGDVALPALAGATRYVLDVTVAFESRRAATITGHADIRYTNQTGAALDEVALMLWPNHPTQYLSRMELGTVTVAGTEVEPAFERDGLAARLPLATPLAPGDHVDLSADFVVRARGGVEQGQSRFGLTHGVLLAPSFYPMIPRWVNGDWDTQPAPEGGDTTNSDASYYAWRITAPADLAVAATGAVVEQSATATSQTQVLMTGPVRDLALVVGPLTRSQRTVDGITVNAYVLDEHASEAEPLLDQAEAQILNLEDRVGPYPYTELDVIDAPGAFGGIEYPAVIFIGVVGDSGYEQATVHEVGHQWFYGLVGDDQLREPWLDEAAASYTEVLYEERTGGEQAAQSHLDYFGLYVASSQHADLPIGLPIVEYPDVSEYYLLVYGKGALFFDALRQRLGDDVFFKFLNDYYDTYRYGFATGTGFQTVAEQTCGCELDDLFDLWVFKGGKVERP